MCPSRIDRFPDMVSAVNDGERPHRLAEILPVLVVAYSEVTVEEHRPAHIAAPERLLSVEVESAMEIDASPSQGVVSALHVAVVE